MRAAIDRPTGMNDKLPADAYAAREIKARLQACMESFGYKLVETPIIEHRELFLRKSGEELLSKLFTFERWNKKPCLRPEFTASIGRLFVEQLQSMPKPIRVQFVGPVFRYERPGRDRSRQFTVAGAELIGAEGKAADAEIIAMACDGLGQVGIANYELVIGHVGVVRQFLENLNLRPRACRFVIGHMENLRGPEKGRGFVDEKLKKMYPRSTQATEATQKTERSQQEIIQLILPQDEMVEQVENNLQEDIGLALSMIFESDQATLPTSRNQEEILERWRKKLYQTSETPLIERALDFAEELGQIKGPPCKVLQHTEELLDASSYKLDKTVLRDLQNTMRLLECYGIPEQNITIDMGLVRGVHYYTGMVFEIHTSPSEERRQLCGGGRYDNLLRILGSGQNTPVVGFAYGLERIVNEANRATERTSEWVQVTKVLVVPVSRQETDYAIELAQYLRKQLGMNVELDVKTNRSVRYNLSHANKCGIRYVAIVGAEEKVQRTVTVKRMSDGKQDCVQFDELAHTPIFLEKSDARENLPK
jgi:histidyl-tRNA synthetase